MTMAEKMAAKMLAKKAGTATQTTPTTQITTQAPAEVAVAEPEVQISVEDIKASTEPTLNAAIEAATAPVAPTPAATTTVVETANGADEITTTTVVELTSKELLNLSKGNANRLKGMVVKHTPKSVFVNDIANESGYSGGKNLNKRKGAFDQQRNLLVSLSKSVGFTIFDSTAAASEVAAAPAVFQEKTEVKAPVATAQKPAEVAMERTDDSAAIPALVADKPASSVATAPDATVNNAPTNTTPAANVATEKPKGATVIPQGVPVTKSASGKDVVDLAKVGQKVNKPQVIKDLSELAPKHSNNNASNNNKKFVPKNADEAVIMGVTRRPNFDPWGLTTPTYLQAKNQVIGLHTQDILHGADPNWSWKHVAGTLRIPMFLSACLKPRKEHGFVVDFSKPVNFVEPNWVTKDVWETIVLLQESTGVSEFDMVCEVDGYIGFVMKSA